MVKAVTRRFMENAAAWESKVRDPVGRKENRLYRSQPVYNVYPYLRDCVQSAGAELPELGVALVDDGSTDGGELCDELAGWRMAASSSISPIRPV